MKDWCITDAPYWGLKDFTPDAISGFPKICIFVEKLTSHSESDIKSN
jgi:hypothetical protein